MIGKDEEIHNFTFPLLFAGHGGGSTTGTNYQVKIMMLMIGEMYKFVMLLGSFFHQKQPKIWKYWWFVFCFGIFLKMPRKSDRFGYHWNSSNCMKMHQAKWSWWVWWEISFGTIWPDHHGHYWQWVWQNQWKTKIAISVLKNTFTEFSTSMHECALMSVWSLGWPLLAMRGTQSLAISVL